MQMDIQSEKKFGDAFEKRVAYTSVTGPQEAVILPAGKKASGAISGTFNAKLEVTASSLAAIEAGTAVWFDVAAAGSTAVLLDLSAKAANAVRINIVSGNPVMEIYAG